MANSTLDLLLQRRSIRSFTGDHVRDEDLDLIIRATQQSATSINGEQISLVVVRDKETIAKIAELAGGQPQVAGADVFVAFIMDFHRTSVAAQLKGATQVIHEHQEGILAGAVDAGIALATFQTAAHALGYGTTAIGGIRKNAAAIAELLGLPQRTFAVVGSTLGVANQDKLPQVKPRVPLETFAMAERYDAEAVARGVEEYDQTLRAWWDAQGMTQMGTYSDDISRAYSIVYYPTVAQALRDQGLGGND